MPWKLNNQTPNIHSSFFSNLKQLEQINKGKLDLVLLKSIVWFKNSVHQDFRCLMNLKHVKGDHPFVYE